VVGIKVCFRDFFMTPPALCHDVELKTLFISATNRVRRMAIAAYWQLPVGVFSPPYMDTLFELLLDAVVTATACRRHPARVDARPRVAFRQHTMGSVAIRAHCCDRESTFHESLAMYAFRISLNDFVLAPDIAGGRLLTFAMATGTQIGNIRGKRHGPRIRLPANPVGAVTLLAGRCVRVIFRNQFPMQAFLVLLPDLCVAGCTINFPGDGFAGSHTGGINACMALAARRLVVPRAGNVIGIDKQRSAVFRRPDVLVFMTAHTVLVRHSLVVKYFPYLVRLVTIDARRQHIHLLFPQFTFYDFPVNGFNLSMAFGAGCRNAPAGN
jgi:hypothetical protein